jgi:serine/threonine protein kinase
MCVNTHFLFSHLDPMLSIYISTSDRLHSCILTTTAENVLLSEVGYLKLTDFGLAKKLKCGHEFTHTLCGTPAYAAPEVYQRTGHNEAADWWTFGVLFHEMLTG